MNDLVRFNLGTVTNTGAGEGDEDDRISMIIVAEALDHPSLVDNTQASISVEIKSENALLKVGHTPVYIRKDIPLTVVCAIYLTSFHSG